MKIRLGPLPRSEPIKITITIPSVLKARLDQYARMHAEVWGGDPVDPTMLIPHMLEQFMARDRAFNAALKSQPGYARRTDAE